MERIRRGERRLIETIRMFGENQIGLDKYEERYNTIKQALIKAQEQEKVLEIILEKNINFERFKSDLLIIGNFTYRYYVNNFGNYHNGIVVKLLTKEEFNLLKRYLRWAKN